MSLQPDLTGFQNLSGLIADEHLFGWDATEGIVSVWAERDGQALVWRRVEGRVVCERERFRPWLFAAHLDDLPAAPRTVAETFHVLTLDGPADSYRYLVSAASGRALEHALVAGATKRLGRAIKNLYDLETDYYRVGPVEQYLMATGRVFFRGLSYADLHRLQFDLETTALDPQRGRIFMAAVRDNRGLATVLDAPTPADEARLIADLVALIRERDPDVIENHNLFGFDLPFLEGRARALGVPLSLGRREGPPGLESFTEPGGYNAPRRARYSVAGRELIDTLDAVRRHDFVARDLPSHRLKDVARHFGVAAPARTYIAGADVFATYRQDPASVRRYALDDVAEVDALSQRLMGATFALAGMAPRRYERLASAGPAMGILEPLLVRAYLRAGVALPRGAARGADMGQHEGGALHLFATGVAERVVKADVASLYPSIMRVYRVGPQCDRLGVLLQIVDRMTQLRLEHKALARQAAPGSLAHGQHGAMQAAMKLLINSAYGYMGAGAMALFADARAADEVTRRGREILAQVCGLLEARGVRLIEADTDGVYFTVLPGWTEDRERAVVAEVAARLPAGIQLEYEGRYRAMFSHEVKNYALLTDDGRLVVRGVALRSSRSEPFGERFLRAALHCLLVGDVPGVRQAYLDTGAALQNRQLTAADVASRVRLSKSYETYQATRARQREAQYEALLSAGRTGWRRGERVRFYRAQDGRSVWLPDETDEPSVDTGWEGDGEADRDVSVASSSGMSTPGDLAERRDYDVNHYLQVLLTSYAGRLRKAFAPDDFDRLFRLERQPGLFDRPVADIQPLWIRAGSDPEPEKTE